MVTIYALMLSIIFNHMIEAMQVKPPGPHIEYPKNRVPARSVGGAPRCRLRALQPKGSQLSLAFARGLCDHSGRHEIQEQLGEVVLDTSARTGE